MNKREKARDEHRKNLITLLWKHYNKLLDPHVTQYLMGRCINDVTIHGTSITRMEKDGRMTNIRPSEFFCNPPPVSQSPDFVPDRWRASDRFKPDDGITLCLGAYYFETSGGREIRPARALPFL